jgi:hypothetical protein
MILPVGKELGIYFEDDFDKAAQLVVDITKQPREYAQDR